MVEHIKFQKITQFKETMRHARVNSVGEVNFLGTVKLHGTNVGIQMSGLPGARRYHAQSRNRLLSVGSDHMEFAAWVADNRSIMRAIDNEFFDSRYVDGVVFAEWVGPGVQKKVGISQLEQKQAGR